MWIFTKRAHFFTIRAYRLEIYTNLRCHTSVASMTNMEERGLTMKKITTEHKAAKTITSVLNAVLRTEANTVSSLVFYQPKAPKDLMRFKNNK